MFPSQIRAAIENAVAAQVECTFVTTSEHVFYATPVELLTRSVRIIPRGKTKSTTFDTRTLVRVMPTPSPETKGAA